MANQSVLTVDRYTRTVLTVLAVLMGIISIELWNQQPAMIATARAQVPDSGLQRQKQLDEMRRTNDLLAQILDRLENKTITVQIKNGPKSPTTRGKN